MPWQSAEPGWFAQHWLTMRKNGKAPSMPPPQVWPADHSVMQERTSASACVVAPAWQRCTHPLQLVPVKPRPPMPEPSAGFTVRFSTAQSAMSWQVSSQPARGVDGHSTGVAGGSS